MTDRFVKNKHTGKICKVEKVEVIRGLTVYIFSNGNRYNLENYWNHWKAIIPYVPYLSDYGINRKYKFGTKKMITSTQGYIK